MSRSHHRQPRAKRRRALYLAVASVAASAAAASRSQGDVIIYNHAGGGLFNTALDIYRAWFDSTVPANLDFPPIGSDALIGRSGTNGFAGITVIQNAAYGGTGLNSLTIDSQDILNQNGTSSVL